jgi:aspartyl-tRNA(Asn)/glutamyl-tRNA(Gln) amidotransferase subunit A
MKLKTLRKQLDSKQISVAELTQDYISRAKASDLNALITICEPDTEIAQNLIDSGKATALTGIPVTIKDNICTAGIKTTNASKMLENFVPFYDAEVVTQLKSQGAVIVGKNNMDEFAMGNSNRTSHFGNVHNPREYERTPGGSSGGSAAAVAGGLCAYSIGTDTGGSVRQPAAHCGITGLKPTYGRISRQGVTAFAGSFDTVGILAQSAEDCGIVLESLCNGTPGSSCPTNGRPIVAPTKIAVVKEWLTDAVEPPVMSAITQTIELLKSQNMEIVELSMPTLPLAAPAYFCLASAEGVSALSRFDGVKYGLKGEGATYDAQLRDSRTRGFGDEVKRRLMLGNFVLSGENMTDYYRKSQAIRRQIIREFDEVFAKADAIISPTSFRTAFELSEPSDYVKIYSSTLYTVPMNLAGLPCVSVPVGNLTGGSPVGISITGRKFDEAAILQIASTIEGGLS